jgi:hypothetical protein
MKFLDRTEPHSKSGGVGHPGFFLSEKSLLKRLQALFAKRLSCEKSYDWMAFRAGCPR